MSRILVRAVIFACLGACGARTGFDSPDHLPPPIDAGVDASPPVVAPLCLVPLSPGALRFKVKGALAGAAIDTEGNYYVPVSTSPNRVDMVSLGPCGDERWRVNVTTQSTWPDPQFVVRLVPEGDVVLESVARFTDDGQRFYRFTPAGAALPPFAIDRDRSGGILGVVPGGGPAFLLSTPDAAIPSFVEFDSGGNLRGENAGFQSSDGECAMGRNVAGLPSGTYVSCMAIAYSVASHGAVWERAHELLDGTSVNVLPPALDADRMVLLVFGISTYDLLIRSRATGQDMSRTPLARSIRGQADLLAGRPVLGADGTAYVYLDVHRSAPPDGQLMAISPGGDIQWTFAAPATKEEFIHDETHLVGQGGIVYLAVGSRLYAVDRRGTEAWSVDTKTPVNVSRPALSPFGDLAIHADDDELLVYATDSKGLEASAWPSPYADAAHTNAR